MTLYLNIMWSLPWTVPNTTNLPLGETAAVEMPLHRFANFLCEIAGTMFWSKKKIHFTIITRPKSGLELRSTDILIVTFCEKDRTYEGVQYTITANIQLLPSKQLFRGWQLDVHLILEQKLFYYNENTIKRTV